MDILLPKSLPSCDRLLTKPTSVAISLEDIYHIQVVEHTMIHSR